MSKLMEADTAEAMADTDEEQAPPKRVRRSAEESQRVILDAAAKRLAEQGPEGIRLQDIARDVGISHPAILHHFSSRAGLVAALVDRATTQLRENLLTVLDGGDGVSVESQAPRLVNDTFEAMSDQGAAKLLAWLVMTGAGPKRNPTLDVMPDIVDRSHSARCQLADKANEPRPDKEDTVFLTLLVANAAFGEAVMGDYYYKACGFGDDKNVRQRFREWLGDLIAVHTQAKPNT
ncbi:MAG: TetR/AcrR family transcriptional regulator [Parvibaculum sp.]